MKIRVQTGSVLNNAPVEAEDVTYVACLDAYGQVFAIIEQTGEDTYFVCTRSDEQFPDILKRLGLGKPVPMREVTNGANTNA